MPSHRRLWAIGEVTGVALFTHVAKYQARVVADTILGKPRRADHTAILRVVFGRPEIAAAGLTTAQARDRGIEIATAGLDLAEAITRPWTKPTHPAPSCCSPTTAAGPDRRLGRRAAGRGVDPPGRPRHPRRHPPSTRCGTVSPSTPPSARRTCKAAELLDL